MTENAAYYEYGTNGTDTGRPVWIEDGSGRYECHYDALGNVTSEVRSVIMPDDSIAYRFKMQYRYDSWGRMLSMTYPDSETVSYTYQWGGDLYAMHGYKSGNYRPYIIQTTYNTLGQKTFVEYGDLSKAYYTYDILHRLSNLTSKDRRDSLMQNIEYTFDGAGNITHIYNAAGQVNAMGGTYTNHYDYDSLYRLVQSVGFGTAGNYSYTMNLSPSGRLLHKQTTAASSSLRNEVSMAYGYCDTYQPHAPRRIKDTENQRLYDLQWDRAGNLGQCNTAKDDGSWLGSRHLFWTIDNRMHSAVDADNYSYYTYDYTGERTLKLTGRNSEMDVNAELQHTSAALDRPTLYPSPYLVMGMHGYTKHYYAGTERICAKTGGGFGESISKSLPDLQAAADSLFSQSRENVRCRELLQNDMECVASYGHVPDAEMNVHLYEMPSHFRADAEIHIGEFHRVVEWCEHGSEEEDKVFFYHSDHLGSASWITDAHGDAIQHLQYLPYGEPFVDQRISGYSERFRFTGKERDEETGFGYFGARYMDHELMTMWLSVDPLSDKYPNISPYAYCVWNPTKLVDPYGMDTLLFNQHGKFQGTILSQGDPVGKIIQKDGSYVCFDFADPVHDVESAKTNKDFKVTLIDDETINDYIKGSGVDEAAKKLPGLWWIRLARACDYIRKHSNAGTSPDDPFTLDYTCRLWLSDDILYVVNVGKRYTGHNGHNFGNFLWGASAQRLGVPLLIALAGAQYNNRFLSKDENGGKWDSLDDQRSIYLGHTWARRYNP